MESFELVPLKAFGSASKNAIELRSMLITPAALAHVQQLLHDDIIPSETSSNTQKGFRIRVDSGGCKGFQYVFSIDQIDFINDSIADIILHYNGTNIIVDDLSLDLIKDTIIDYKQELIGAAFQLINPNAAASCGCNNSFTI